MKHLLLLLFIISTGLLSSQNYYPYQGIAFNKVKLLDNFWLPKIEKNRTVTIPWSFGKCQETGRIKNFEMAANRSGKFNSPYVFDDTDVYKTIEGAAYSLQVRYDEKLDHYIDSLITIIAAAQEEDGYLYTVRTMGDHHEWSGSERYEKEHELSHELYNMGHFYEAATAHYWATGKRNMLEIAEKNAAHLLTVFGPGKKSVAPGHQVIEIGLVKMYTATGNKDYLELAQFFIECRGKRSYAKKPGTKDATVWETGEYWQDHIPVTQQTEAIGHAVRATYLYAGMADVAALTQNKTYIDAIHKIWENAAGKKTYITGGIGAAGGWEGFGPDYDLPNDKAYCETCAGIGNVYWNHRMFMLTGDGKYMDMVERTLYNGILGGIGLDGKSFYYANPMEYTMKNKKLSGENKRSPWFGCSCCPSNVCRFMPSVPGYIYAKNGSDFYINLFMSSSTIHIINNQEIEINQSSELPWFGKVNINIKSKNDQAAMFKLYIRLPGYLTAQLFPTDLYTENHKKAHPLLLKINGKAQVANINNMGYVVLEQFWKDDKISLEFDLDVIEVAGNKNIQATQNMRALQRGPLLYCAEFLDNDNRTSNIVLPTTASYKVSHEKNLLDGISIISTKGNKIEIKSNMVNTVSKNIKLIPYYARSNRGVGEMRLWFPTSVSNVTIEP
jgi:uncharacterized protein